MYGPYKTFEETANKVKAYFRVIYEDKEENNEKFQKGKEELEKCDCSKYQCKKLLESEHEDEDEDELEGEDQEYDFSGEEEKEEKTGELLLKKEECI